MNPIYAYGAALLTVGVLDALWLGFIARDLYRREMGHLMAESLRWGPAAVFYLGYPAGIVALALTPAPASLAAAATKGALLGLVAYGAYDMTNLATLKGFTLKIALIDLAWGTLVTASAAAAGYAAARWAQSH